MVITTLSYSIRVSGCSPYDMFRPYMAILKYTACCKLIYCINFQTRGAHITMLQLPRSNWKFYESYINKAANKLLNNYSMQQDV
jgi:hypothetical protein